MVLQDSVRTCMQLQHREHQQSSDHIQSNHQVKLKEQMVNKCLQPPHCN